MRGIDFINCPTTTLSMIESTIGGKTAVDLGEMCIRDRYPTKYSLSPITAFSSKSTSSFFPI